MVGVGGGGGGAPGGVVLAGVDDQTGGGGGVLRAPGQRRASVGARTRREDLGSQGGVAGWWWSRVWQAAAGERTASGAVVVTGATGAARGGVAAVHPAAAGDQIGDYCRSGDSRRLTRVERQHARLPKTAKAWRLDDDWMAGTCLRFRAAKTLDFGSGEEADEGAVGEYLQRTWSIETNR